MQAFAIFCGLGIHNAQMYDKACKLMARHKVAFEVLSFHAMATNEETNAFMVCATIMHCTTDDNPFLQSFIFDCLEGFKLKFIFPFYIVYFFITAVKLFSF